MRATKHLLLLNEARSKSASTLTDPNWNSGNAIPGHDAMPTQILSSHCQRVCWNVSASRFRLAWENAVLMSIALFRTVEKSAYVHPSASLVVQRALILGSCTIPAIVTSAASIINHVADISSDQQSKNLPAVLYIKWEKRLWERRS